MLFPSAQAMILKVNFGKAGFAAGDNGKSLSAMISGGKLNSREKPVRVGLDAHNRDFREYY